MATISRIKPGQVLWDISSRRMGNTTYRTQSLYEVRVLEVNHEQGWVLASWNGNKAERYAAHRVKHWKVNKPVAIPGFFGSVKYVSKRKGGGLFVMHALTATFLSFAGWLMLGSDNVTAVVLCGIAFLSGVIGMATGPLKGLFDVTSGYGSMAGTEEGAPDRQQDGGRHESTEGRSGVGEAAGTQDRDDRGAADEHVGRPLREQGDGLGHCS